MNMYMQKNKTKTNLNKKLTRTQEEKICFILSDRITDFGKPTKI